MPIYFTCQWRRGRRSWVRRRSCPAWRTDGRWGWSTSCPRLRQVGYQQKSAVRVVNAAQMRCAVRPGAAGHERRPTVERARGGGGAPQRATSLAGAFADVPARSRPPCFVRRRTHTPAPTSPAVSTATTMTITTVLPPPPPPPVDPAPSAGSGPSLLPPPGGSWRSLPRVLLPLDLVAPPSAPLVAGLAEGSSPSPPTLTTGPCFVSTAMVLTP